LWVQHRILEGLNTFFGLPARANSCSASAGWFPRNATDFEGETQSVAETITAVVET
jgi:hypothetical protein